MARAASQGLLRPAGPRLTRQIPLPFVTRRNRGGRRSMFAELNLTSMVDMLTILVVFLLQTFTVSGELSVSRDIRLPDARNHDDVAQAPIVAVSRQVVTLNGAPVADTATLLQGESADWRLAELHDQLVMLKNNYQLLHPDPQDFKGQLLVQADQQVDFKALKKVLYTCSLAGYHNISFAVNPAARGS
jgi:biopolymer transport protein ExbD